MIESRNDDDDVYDDVYDDDNDDQHNGYDDEGEGITILLCNTSPDLDLKSRFSALGNTFERQYMESNL